MSTLSEQLADAIPRAPEERQGHLRGGRPQARAEEFLAFAQNAFDAAFDLSAFR